MCIRDSLHKAAVLQPGVLLRGRPLLVRHRKVGEDPLRPQVGQGGDLGDFLHRLGAKKAQAAHPRIHLYVDVQLLLPAGQGLLQLPGIVQGEDRLDDAVAHQVAHALHRGEAQNQDGAVDPPLPQGRCV